MKFEDESPEKGIIQVDNLQPCWNCGENTQYRDIDFQAPLCSDECQKTKIDEFYAALQGNETMGD